MLEFGARIKATYSKGANLDRDQVDELLGKARFTRLPLPPGLACGGHSRDEYATVRLKDGDETYCLKGNGCPNRILGHIGECYKKTPLNRTSSKVVCRCVHIPFTGNGETPLELYDADDADGGDNTGATRMFVHVVYEVMIEKRAVILKQRERLRYWRAGAVGGPRATRYLSAIDKAKLDETLTWGSCRMIFLNAIIFHAVGHFKVDDAFDPMVAALMISVRESYKDTIDRNKEKSKNQTAEYKRNVPDFLALTEQQDRRRAVFASNPLNSIASYMKYWLVSCSGCTRGRADADARTVNHAQLIREMRRVANDLRVGYDDDSQAALAEIDAVNKIQAAAARKAELLIDAVASFLDKLDDICIRSRACVAKVAELRLGRKEGSITARKG
jgi:hypothetical protein